MSTVLLVSPDAKLHRFVEDCVQRVRDCQYAGFDDSERALDEIVDAAPSIILAHARSADQVRSYVLPLVETIGTKSPPIPIVVIADEYQGREFRDLLVAGASECLTRPLDAARLGFLIESLNLANCPTRNASPSSLERAAAEASASYRDICEKALLIAAKNMPVLLTGETGVGKSYLARQIHESSPRRHHPFVSINCSAISEHLAESELFGHMKGAFTGASQDYEGHLAAAGHGSLFLDELDTLSLAMQAKLLHVLDDHVFTPVGSVKPQKFQARLLAATNQPIKQVVAEKKFRKDLYFRIRVVELQIPPLRERRQEIRPLVTCFLRQLCHSGKVPQVTNEAWARLEAYDWPGNLRELRNAIEYSLAFMPGKVLAPEWLPSLSGSVPTPPTTVAAPVPTTLAPVSTQEEIERTQSMSNRRPLEEARHHGERQKLLRMLELHNFNKTRVAGELGISRNGLYKRLRVLGI